VVAIVLVTDTATPWRGRGVVIVERSCSGSRRRVVDVRLDRTGGVATSRDHFEIVVESTNGSKVASFICVALTGTLCSPETFYGHRAGGFETTTLLLRSMLEKSKTEYSSVVVPVEVR
jgi:hypothetical protein